VGGGRRAAGSSAGFADAGTLTGAEFSLVAGISVVADELVEASIVLSLVHATRKKTVAPIIQKIFFILLSITVITRYIHLLLKPIP
jgi:hypothetical protein